MDKDRLERVLKGQLKMQGIGFDESEIVTDAIDQAAVFFWNCYRWNFRRKESSITLTGSQDYIGLPDDFAQFKTLGHEDGTTEGWQITYESEDRFEYAHPNPSMISEGGPRSVKIVYDSDTSTWRAYFSPIPDAGYTEVLVYFTKFGSLSDIPEGFAQVFNAACWLFIHPVGSSSYYNAERSFAAAQEAAKNGADKIYQGEPSTVRRASRFRVDGDDDCSDALFDIEGGF